MMVRQDRRPRTVGSNTKKKKNHPGLVEKNKRRVKRSQSGKTW